MKTDGYQGLTVFQCFSNFREIYTLSESSCGKFEGSDMIPRIASIRRMKGECSYFHYGDLADRQSVNFPLQGLALFQLTDPPFPSGVQKNAK